MIMRASASTVHVLVCAAHVFLTALTAVAVGADSATCTACDRPLLTRSAFPHGFVFGSASAAYQVEGAYDENGKGPGMWDYFTHNYSGVVIDHTNGDVAVDSYHLYKEDVQLLKNMGVDAYKFSISWPRILPGGTISEGVNQDGIDYYNNLINELLANGIQPWVTILHLDTPQALEDAYGGFLSSQMVSDFRDFAELLFEMFGDRVKYWITFNEPWAFTYLGYTIGVFAPGRCTNGSLDLDCPVTGNSAIEPYIVTHNQLLAHAVVVKLYKDKYQEAQKGNIGLTVNSFWFLPYDESQESLSAAHRALDFMLGWVMEPVTYGRYPEIMRAQVGDRLPEFSEEEADIVKGSFDFIGLNYYSGKYAFSTANTTNLIKSYTTDGGYDTTGVKDGIKLGEQGSSHSRYYSYPKGLRRLLQHMKLKYNDPLIYITENGLDEDRNDSLPIAEALKDYKRQKYLLDHICCLRESIELDGVNVKGYFAWSLTDNFEWASGYLVRFGLHYVDYNSKSFTRYPKYSAQWLRRILAPPRVDQVPRSVMPPPEWLSTPA